MKTSIPNYLLTSECCKAVVVESPFHIDKVCSKCNKPGDCGVFEAEVKEAEIVTGIVDTWWSRLFLKHTDTVWIKNKYLLWIERKWKKYDLFN
jgi:hypothetical protein